MRSLSFPYISGFLKSFTVGTSLIFKKLIALQS